MPPAARLTISRADVAHFLLDEVEHPEHVRRIIGLASVKANPTTSVAGKATHTEKPAAK